MSYVITTPFHKNYEEKLRVGRKRVILLNCAHRDCLRSDVKAERFCYGGLGIDGGCE